MSKFSWNSALAGAAVLAGTVYVFAAQLAPGAGGPMGSHELMHQQMMQGGGVPGGMGHHGASNVPQVNAVAVPTLPGQDAFGAIQEVVRILESDPTTDWSKVNIAALREHLVDMNEVTLRARAETRVMNNGVAIAITGEGRTLDAIRRMVPAHVHELREIGFDAVTGELPNGVMLTVTASAAQPLTKLKALGFMGLMVQGGHHQPHHLMMAKGEFVH
jgi:hypothetical protein